MSRRRALVEHRDQFKEMREIINSMKALTWIELRKLEAEQQNRQLLADHIDSIAADFGAFYPGFLQLPGFLQTPGFSQSPSSCENTNVYVVIGSERGFCANFNHALLPQLPTDRAIKIIVVGAKLQTLLATDTRVVSRLEGARVAQQMDAVLGELSDTLVALQHRLGGFSLRVLRHNGGDAKPDISTDILLPPFQSVAASKPPHKYGSPPWLTLAPQRFFALLVEHYLFFALSDALHASLLRENEMRAAHLDAAVKHLEQKIAGLKRQANALRQEEITEEIEEILLGVEG